MRISNLFLYFITLPAIVSFSLGDTPFKLTAKWSKYMVEIYVPRSGHTSFLIDRDLYTFGGYAEQFQQQSIKRYPINDLMKITLQKSFYATAEQILGFGDVPTKRLVSSSAVLNGRAYLFGGWDSEDTETGGSIFMDTIHVFEPTSRKWTKLSTTIPDGGTSRHVTFSLLSQSKIVIHNHRCLNFIYVFDPATGSVVKQPTQNNDDGPSSRGLHACCMLDDVYCIIFGGAAQDGTMSNESFLLNTISWTWTKLHIEDIPSTKRSDLCELSIPQPRAGHNIVSFNENTVVLFGGAVQSKHGLEPLNDLWALHVNITRGCGYWQKIDIILDDAPPPRNAATLTEIYNHVDDLTVGSQNKYYALVGGWAPFRQTFNDTFILSICSTS